MNDQTIRTPRATAARRAPRAHAALLIPVLLIAAIASGCAETAPARTDESLGVLTDRTRSTRTRVEAISRARVEAGDDRAARERLHAALRTLAWDLSSPAAARVEAMRALLDDPDPAVVEDARQAGRLMLPREPSPAMVALLSSRAAARGWEDYTASLVRSLGRPLAGIPDESRDELAALRVLARDQDPIDAVVGVFVDPPPAPPRYGLDWAQRCRADAWDVLARLDPTGERRVPAIARARGRASRESAAVIERVMEGDGALRAVPVTGAELAWLEAMRGGAGAWWEEARAAIGAVPRERSGRLALRHAEVIRFATSRHPSWVAMGREELLSEARARLASRRVATRERGSLGQGARERLELAEPALAWADVLTILVLDEAVRDPAITESLFEQARLDRRDKTTEYGGMIIACERRGGCEGAVVAELFPPRPSERRGDHQFVASDDLLSASAEALAHYHFHAQSPSNGAYAGPSEGDLDYASRLGRACLVFTTIADDRINVDFYQPGGVVVDLGTIERSQ